MGDVHRLTREERFERYLDGDSHQLQELKDLHQEVIRLHTAGLRPSEIAKTLGITRQWATAVRNSHLGTEEAERLKSLRDDISLDFASKLRNGGDYSLDYLVGVMTPDTQQSKAFDMMPALKVKVAQDLLDRDARAPKATRTDARSIHVHATAEDLARIRARALERKRLPANEGLEDAAVGTSTALHPAVIDV